MVIILREYENKIKKNKIPFIWVFWRELKMKKTFGRRKLKMKKFFGGSFFHFKKTFGGRVVEEKTFSKNKI